MPSSENEVSVFLHINDYNFIIILPIGVDKYYRVPTTDTPTVHRRNYYCQTVLNLHHRQRASVT